MAFTTFSGLTAGAGVLPTEYVKEVFKMLPEKSACVQAFRTINMGAHTTVLPVLTGLATASFVSEGAAITASNATWTGKNLVAEKVACIVPISKELWNDGNLQWGPEIMEQAVTAIGKAIDAAIFHETSKPTSWTASGIIVGASGATSGVVDYSTEIAASATVAEIISKAMAFPEAGGFEVNGFILHPTMKAKLRGAKDTTGQPLFQPMTGGYPATLYGEEVIFAKNGGMDGTKLLGVCGDMSRGVIGLREDMTVELLREATITVGGDSISLAQNDMVALKFVFRCAYQVAVNATGLGTTGIYPFAVIVP